MRSRSLQISAITCASTVTSSAVVGSSAMSRSGRASSAMAIATRWRMPPLSSCGYCVRRRSRPVDADRGQGVASGLPLASRRPSSGERRRSTS